MVFPVLIGLNSLNKIGKGVVPWVAMVSARVITKGVYSSL